MIAEKPPKLVAVALANKMARIIWALSVKKEPTGRQQRLPLVRNSCLEEKGCLALERRAVDWSAPLDPDR